ncbi:MAG: short-chain dehydrogenase [gamma proteobacterium symbiont of Ctena orbiculata]|uniref:SDR family oxidoreductase n=1 Tax=Candidatus Thiodiazotropha taylori TaxID=2792791 RepID=A0A944QSW3_9GAMM|nr:SDR family oxidoreductase [Candidatus Thiodiazotropha taylori]PUB80272.1 MAG: short-chain dehydrogenase [gamma proteobacterium symbiont of Ctena orbiculata]MBT2989328.1 SDR family oxidoreductase [Candidatus Thiodiazotropha taylori]MBT2996908.1 SDR family oxidoreductase [Candidatus Thiodiazotropha taylori]MBT3000763.1 SDR family oxidoreductase [Candidatus Thiodiazotropha taylori]
MNNFKDKVVVITGGATGIGFGFARAFGKEGAKIIIAGRNENRLQEAVSYLTGSGIEARYSVCDVTRQEDIEALADFSWEAHGHVDVIINNAGIMVPHAPFLDMPIEHIQQIFAVNFYGVVYGSKVFGKRFVEQGTPAAIYNIGSENSLFHGTPFNGAYVATKHSVLAITQSLYEELPDFIEVGLVCPGFVVSELGPEEAMQHGMPTDQFIDIAMKQIKAGEFFIVSHAYNIERINKKHAQLTRAYETYAPRYEGDQQYDVRTIIQPMLEEQVGRKLRS